MGITITGSDLTDFYYGTPTDDLFISSLGTDYMYGLAGDDRFQFGAVGSNTTFTVTAYGGLGNDVYAFTTTAISTTNVTIGEQADAGIDTIVAVGSFLLTSVPNIENLVVRHDGFGNDANNRIEVMDSNEATKNTLDGGGGNDLLIGGAHGAPVGIPEGDDLRGGAGIDTASYETAPAGVTAGLLTGGLAGHALADFYSSIENLTGSRFNDTLSGDHTANRLDGGLGDDTLIGNGGVDTMVGRAGNDTYSANLSSDVAVEAAGGGVDRVVWVGTAGTFTLGTNVENMVIQGTSAIGGTGNALGNTIAGNGASNILTGKGGNDVLTGGGGADVFVLDTAPGAGNLDTLTDMSGTDFIRLSKPIFAAIGPTFTSNEFRVNTTGLAGDADDRIIYEADAGRLFYDTNGSAAGGAVQIATLSLKPGISIADFQFV